MCVCVRRVCTCSESVVTWAGLHQFVFESVATWAGLYQHVLKVLPRGQDYINIELDNHRNQLIRLELLLTAATFSVALVGGVSGIFGMNLNNTHQDSYLIFVLVSYASLCGVYCVLLILQLPASVRTSGLQVVAVR